MWIHLCDYGMLAVSVLWLVLPDCGECVVVGFGPCTCVTDMEGMHGAGARDSHT